MTETSGRLLGASLAAPGAPRMGRRASWPIASRCRAGRSGVTSSACARSGIPWSRSGPGRRIPAEPGTASRPSCSTTTRRSRSPSGSRTAARVVGERHRGDRRAGAGQARAGAAGPPEPPRQRARLGDGQPAGRRADGGPSPPDRDRRRLPRLRVPSVRLQAPRRCRDRREVEPHALVNFGRRWYLAAWDRGREDWRSFRVDRLAGRPRWASLHGARAARRGRRRVREREHHRGPAPLRGPRDAARRQPARSRAAYRATGARSSRSTPAPASTGPVTTTWGGSPCASRCCGVDFEVHEPPELVEHLAEIAGRLSRATSGGNAA